jgi:MFS family permease
MASRSEKWELFSNREFVYFISTRFFLTCALQIQSIIVGWHVYELMRDPLALGFIGLAEAIPALSVALYAGHIADIRSKRMILFRSLIVLLVCSSGLALFSSDLAVLGLGATWSIRMMYVWIFISGFARGFYAPTGFAFLAQLVKREHLTTASTLNSTMWQIAAIIGPALGGWLLALTGIIAAFYVVLVFTSIALVLVLLIKPKPVPLHDTNEPVWIRLREGIQYVWSNKVILGALSLDLFAVLFGGAVALLPIFADEILKVGAEGLGMLRAAPSLGASITMIALSVMKPIQSPGRSLLWCVAAFGVSIVAFGLSESFYFSLAILVLYGAFDSVSVVIRGNILQLETPDHMRGRVSAVNSMFIGSSNEIGAFESGLAARLLGTVPSVVAGGGITLIVVTYTAIRSKALRAYRYRH